MNLFDKENQQNCPNQSLNSTTDSSKVLMQEMSDRLKVLSQELKEVKKKGRSEDQDLIRQLSLELLEMRQTLREYVCLNQDFSKANQKLQDELQKALTDLSDTANYNQQLSKENDQLRNRGGLMLREQQEKLKEKIEDIQGQNSKLKKLVDQSNLDAVRAAINERDAALSRATEEKRKANTAKKNAKDEIAKAKKQANVKMLEIKKQLKTWQLTAVGMLVVGLVVGWLL